MAVEEQSDLKYVFGPVPSRRLGQSLGIDTIPLKTCNWNCVYCQLGRTIPLTHHFQEYFPRKDILSELTTVLDWNRPEPIQWITFVGSGEPTLHTGIGWLIQHIKQLTEIPVAVITNGSSLYLPEVREGLLRADAVLPTLDAGTEELYKRINRPHPEATYSRLIGGLQRFREEYQGRLWIEVMLVKDLNDSETALRALADQLSRLHPDQIHLVKPTRPPAETWVQPPDQQGILRAQAILGDTARILPPADGLFDLSEYTDLSEAALGVIARHPLREDQLLEILNRWAPDQVRETLQNLKLSGKAQTVQRCGVQFWSSSKANFPGQENSHRTRSSDKPG